MEPVSESNRFDFDLLADYNPDVPVEHKAKKSAKLKMTGQEDSRPREFGPRRPRPPNPSRPRRRL